MGTWEGINARPYQLMCILCHIGEGRSDGPEDEALDRILSAVRTNPAAPVTLRCNADTVYGYQNPGRAQDTPEGPLFNDKRDLDILQRMGLAPGDTRPACELFDRLIEAVATAEGICG